MKAAVNSHPEQNRSSKAEGGTHGDGPGHQQTTPSCHMDLNVTLLPPPSDHGITIKQWWHKAKELLASLIQVW